MLTVNAAVRKVHCNVCNGVWVQEYMPKLRATIVPLQILKMSVINIFSVFAIFAQFSHENGSFTGRVGVRSLRVGVHILTVRVKKNFNFKHWPPARIIYE